MIEGILKNLEKGRFLLENISNEQYADKSVAPYYSSIGNHMRHILDMFNCIFKGYDAQRIDLTERDRNLNVENYTNHGIDYFNYIIDKVKNLKGVNFDQVIDIVDDLGCGCCTVKSTLGSVLAQAQSHAIHHYATIGYIIHSLEISLSIAGFGVNPTTPKEVSVNN